MTTDTCNFETIAPREAKRRLDDGSAILIDIRDANEFARVHIPGARLVPVAAIDAHDFDRERAAGKAAIFHCQSGRRTMLNAARLLAAGFKETYALEGGLDAWRAAGLPARVDRAQPIELQRQVQIAAGSLVVLGVLLAALVSPWFILISAFVGAGLVFAGATGTCGMASLLMLAPWNKPASAA